MEASESRRAKRSFLEVYKQQCALQDCSPLREVTERLLDNLIDCRADRITHAEWGPILDALKHKNSLKFIAFRSVCQPIGAAKGKTPQQIHQLKKRLPAIRYRDITDRMCRSLGEFLSLSTCVTCLILQGIPFRESDMYHLAKGMMKNCTLQIISLESSRISDAGLEALASGLKALAKLTSLYLCNCGITWMGMETIQDLIKHQATRRHNEVWRESLRYGMPNLNNIHGLRRIDLSQNTLIGDRGAKIIADALKDDMWIKAIDLQDCGLSSDGVDSLLTALDYNNCLKVLDVRSNPLLEQEKVRAVLEKVMINSGGEDPEYPWRPARKLKDVRKVQSSKKPVRFAMHASSRPKCKRRKRIPDFDIIDSETAKRSLGGHAVRKRKNSVEVNTAARYEQSRDEQRRPTHKLQSKRHGTSSSSSSSTQSSLSNGKDFALRDVKAMPTKDDSTDLKMLKVKLKSLELRYQNEVRERASVELRQKELEVENRKLKYEVSLLKSHFMSSTAGKIEEQPQLVVDSLEDGRSPENVDASYIRFQRYMSVLGNKE